MSLIKNIMPYEAATLPVVKDWDFVGSGREDGDKIIFEDVNGNQALLRWDTSLSSSYLAAAAWRVIDTSGAWVTIPLSKNDARSSAWQSLPAYETGHASFSDANNRLTVTVQDDGLDNSVFLVSNFALAIGVEIRATAFIGFTETSTSGTGDVSVQLGQYDVFEDASNQQNNLQIRTSDTTQVTAHRASGAGLPTISTDLACDNTVSQELRVKMINKLDTTGGVHAHTVTPGYLSEVDVTSGALAGGMINTFLDCDSGISLTGGPYDTYIQDIQVRK